LLLASPWNTGTSGAKPFNVGDVEIRGVADHDNVGLGTGGPNAGQQAAHREHLEQQLSKQAPSPAMLRLVWRPPHKVLATAR
jgi:hypothetical protein